MDIGWMDLCLRVASVKRSREFYEGLGFHKVEGKDDEGWAVMTNGDARIGLYEAQHMGKDAFSLNFRGSDVMAVAEELKAKGYEFYDGPTQTEQGSSAWMKDPDGYTLFFDTMVGETKKE
ncbi:MAG: VOC family protein [Fimbriimonadaceae bacterium]|nr:VOC family protein [Fimbriimonadaceae bacterium]